MIRKDQILNFMAGLESQSPSDSSNVSPPVLARLSAYLVDHYGRLDEEARSFADGFFGQLEEQVEKELDGLAEGETKRRWRWKLAVARGERSPLPTLYLDTPVVETILQAVLSGGDKEQESHKARTLWDGILELAQAGKVICPGNRFHQDMLHAAGPSYQAGLSLLSTLWQGIWLRHNQTIEDFQVLRALRGYIAGRDVNRLRAHSPPLSAGLASEIKTDTILTAKPPRGLPREGFNSYKKYWHDILDRDTVMDLMNRNRSVSFPLLSPSSGAVCQRSVAPGGSDQVWAKLRIQFDAERLRRDQEIQQGFARHLRDMVRFGAKYLDLSRKGDPRHLAGLWARPDATRPLSLWRFCGGQPEGVEGLSAFYGSSTFDATPVIRLKREIWNVLSETHASTNHRPTLPADVAALSCILPYADVLILGQGLAHTVRDRLGLDKEFDATVHTLEQGDQSLAILKAMAESE